MRRGEGNCSKTEQVRKNVKVQESTCFLKAQEMENKPINLWPFVMTHFPGKNHTRSASTKTKSMK